MEEARNKYKLHEKKALRKPTGFYEEKLETLTDMIIVYERHHHEKSRKLNNLKEVGLLG